jgi:hypothetical protein
VSETLTIQVSSGLREELDTITVGQVFYSADGKEALILVEGDDYIISVMDDHRNSVLNGGRPVINSAYLTAERPDDSLNIGWAIGWEA